MVEYVCIVGHIQLLHCYLDTFFKHGILRTITVVPFSNLLVSPKLHEKFNQQNQRSVCIFKYSDILLKKKNICFAAITLVIGLAWLL